MNDSSESTNNPSSTPTPGGGPTSRAGKRWAERRQNRPQEGGPSEQGGSPKPLQAYVPEVHGPQVEVEKKKLAPAPPAKKLFGAQLRRELDDDIEGELAEAMASFESIGDLTKTGPAGSADASSLDLERGSKHTVRVIDVRGDDVFVELGGKSEGMLSVLQFEGNLPKGGDLIEVIVDRFDPATDIYTLRRPGAAQEAADWGSVQKGMIVDAQVKAVNKGGLEITVNGLRGFLPAGQADINRIADLSTLVGKVLRCEVTEANVQAKNLVVSRKRVQEREREELAAKTRESIAVGKIFDGTVRKLMEFGAFVDIGGVDGLIHISQISWQKVRHPSEILKEGDSVKVQVVNYDPQTGKLGLSLRQLSENPWNSIAARFSGGSIVPGKVTRTAEFGAFVELAPGIEGLIHISELSGRRVSRVTEIVREGDSVEVKVLEVDPERQRISLSLKQAAAPPEEPVEEEPAVEEATAEPEKPKKPSKPLNLKGGLGGSSGPLFG